MSDASDNLAVNHESSLLQELEVVQAAIKRSASAQNMSDVSEEWLAKLQKWREELEESLEKAPDRAA